MNLLGDNGFVCFLYGYVLFPGTDYGCWYMLPFCMVHRREYILDINFSAVALPISMQLFLIQWLYMVDRWYFDATGCTDVEVV